MKTEREEANAAVLEMARRILTERTNHVSIFCARAIAKRLIAAEAELHQLQHDLDVATMAMPVTESTTDEDRMRHYSEAGKYWPNSHSNRFHLGLGEG